MSITFIQNSFWSPPAAGPSPPFSPSDLPNLAQWYHSDGITGSATVTNWYDASGNELTLTTTHGTVTTSSLNGYSTAVIDTLSAMKRNANDTFTTPNNNIWMVAKPVVNRIFNAYGPNVLTYEIILFNIDPARGQMRAFARDAGLDTITRNDIAITNPGGYEIWCMSVDGDNKTLRVYDSTGSLYPHTLAAYDGTTVWTPSYHTIAKQTWGAFADNTTHPDLGSCEIAEVIIYNETKSNADINDIGNYLSDKYALTWTDF